MSPRRGLGGRYDVPVGWHPRLSSVGRCAAKSSVSGVQFEPARNRLQREVVLPRMSGPDGAGMLFRHRAQDCVLGWLNRPFRPEDNSNVGKFVKPIGDGPVYYLIT